MPDAPPAAAPPADRLRLVAPSRRAVTLAVVIAAHALLLFLLLRMAAPAPQPPSAAPGPLAVDLLPDPVASPTPTRARAQARRTAGAPPRPAPRPVPAPTPPPPAVDSSAEAAAAAAWRQVIPLGRADYAASDIARMPAAPAAGGGSGDAAGPGRDRDARAAGGGGPNGEKLYEADWQRRPTHAELAGYLPPGAPAEGQGTVACRTAAGFRVEDCVEIDQSPVGSGFARAVRQAAWQFRVKPPRIGGRPLVGAWVRIRITYSATAAAD